MDWYDAAIEYRKRTFPHDCQLTSLPTEWQRELVALMLVNRDVNNGAYLQFFANNGRECYLYASQALVAIGAHRMAQIVDSCQALVDEHNPIEGDSLDERSLLMPGIIIGRDGRVKKEAGSVLPEAIRIRISELSYDFMNYPDNVGELAQQHYGPLIEQDKSL